LLGLWGGSGLREYAERQGRTKGPLFRRKRAGLLKSTIGTLAPDGPSHVKKGGVKEMIHQEFRLMVLGMK